MAAAAAADPQVSFTASGSVVSFTSALNTGGTVSVSGYDLWLITETPNVFIANNIAEQINGCNWEVANTTYGLLAVADAAAITPDGCRNTAP